MNRQRGSIQLAALLIAGAAFAGLWTYYSTQMSALTTDNEAKQATITDLNTKLATSATRATVLQDQNKACGELITEANTKTDALRAERNAAWAGYNDAKAAAARASKGFEQTIAEINATKEGGDWCASWGTLIDGYVRKRQAP
jgi:septal ring factor EnvC (AmiA/AmiB activator)